MWEGDYAFMCSPGLVNNFPSDLIYWIVVNACLTSEFAAINVYDNVMSIYTYIFFSVAFGSPPVALVLASTLWLS